MQGYSHGQATRPSKYPEAILWNLSDCQRVGGLVTNSNPSRPPMEKCVRTQDGHEISAAEYRAVKTSARRFVNTHLTSLKEPSDPAARSRTKTKTYYQKYYPKSWSEAVDKLEESQPLVALCASHWKADHLIGNCLQAIVDEAKKREGADERVEDEPAKLKRPREKQRSDAIPAKKKKQRTEDPLMGKGMFVRVCESILIQLPQTLALLNLCWRLHWVQPLLYLWTFSWRL